MKKTSTWVPLIVAVTFIAGVLTSDFIRQGNGAGTATQKKFQTILNLIRNDYVDEVNLDSLLENSIPGLLENLDPHSAYIPAADLRSVNEELEGSFCGIGVQFMLNNDTITVVEVVSGGPSEKIGMKAGDRIVKVDGEDVAGVGITNEQVLRKLRGECGTPVTLTVRRSGARKPLTMEVIRGELPNTSVDASYMLSDSIGYVRVNKFGRTTYDDFYQALNELQREGAKDYVIDLRGNSGGFMEIAFLMADRKSVV